MDADLALAVDRLARRQRSLITSAQADELLGRSRAARWRATGRLVTVQPHVMRVQGAEETWHQQLLAASLAADAIVSHRSAAALWAIRPDDGSVEVSVEYHRKPRLRSPAQLHRIRDVRRAHAVRRAGLAVTDPIRTVIDLGLVVDPDEVEDALSTGLASKLFPLSAVVRLRDALGRPGRNGTGVVRMLLEDRSLLHSDEGSVLEARFLRVVRRGRLPPPVFQHEIWADGRFVARVDAAWPQALLAVEVDGYAHHGTPAGFQADRTRDVRLAELGWLVLRFTWDDVVGRPDQVAESIRCVLEARRAA